MADGIKLLKSREKYVLNITVTVSVAVLCALFSLFAVNFSSVFFILICGAVGVALFLFARIRNRGRTNK